MVDTVLLIDTAQRITKSTNDLGAVHAVTVEHEQHTVVIILSVSAVFVFVFFVLLQNTGGAQC